MDKQKKKDIIKFVVFMIFLLSIILMCTLYYPKIKDYLNFENVRKFIGDNKILSSLLFILLQIMQVVIFMIPGDVINATGGFMFNIILGSILSFIGVILGSIIVFHISRFFGYNFVNRFIKKEKLDKFVNFFESNTGFVSLFIICNLPFVPKDILMYCAGLTPLKAKKTLPVYCLSRLPGIIIWVSMGANLYSKSVIGIILTLCILLLFLLSIVLIKKKIDGRRIIVVKPSTK